MKNIVDAMKQFGVGKASQGKKRQSGPIIYVGIGYVLS